MTLLGALANGDGGSGFAVVVLVVLSVIAAIARKASQKAQQKRAEEEYLRRRQERGAAAPTPPPAPGRSEMGRIGRVAARLPFADRQVMEPGGRPRPTAYPTRAALAEMPQPVQRAVPTSHISRPQSPQQAAEPLPPEQVIELQEAPEKPAAATAEGVPALLLAGTLQPVPPPRKAQEHPLLRTSADLRQAIMLHEVFSPPRALRRGPELWDI